MKQRKKCFVIMPVSKTKSCTADEWTGIFAQMIKPAVTGSRFGFTCERSEPRTGNLIRDILNELNSADVVIADLTDMNPNVFYELGVRHTLRNRTILIAQDEKYVPSDLRSYWVIFYEKNLSGLQDFKNKVRGILKEMMDNPEKPDSPVADFLENRNISLLSQEKSANVKKLTALLSELSYDLKQIDAVVETANKNKASRLQKKGKLLTYLDMRLQNTCISLLLSTNYIALPEDILAQLQSMNSTIATTNSKLERWGLADSQRLEEQFIDFLPWWKPRMASLFTQLHKIRTDYLSDNYEELVMPPLLLSIKEHEQYIQKKE